MWSSPLTVFWEWKWKICLKETKCKICWICQFADKCEAASSEFSRHKCDRGTLVTLSHKHFHQLVPIPTHPLVGPAWLWGFGLDSNCKRTGSSSTSISSDLAWIHISIGIGAVRGLLSFRLISGVTCLSDFHRPIRDQGQELIFGERKSCIGQVCDLKDDALALDRSRHWDPVIFLQDGEEILTELSTSLNFKTNICCDLHSGFDIEVMKVFN